ncbi:membrane protein insertion efficiency factor YidD [Candidatus Parcubacteria bacterium]|jgi:putative membrane protein insertion efficiency factor|nr:MAG: membrane protein insertion efficiency factor YidD [Candidatus Parcubacteria bacterium]
MSGPTAPTQFFRQSAIKLLRFYQITLSPDHSWLRTRRLTGVCRFQPTCSTYAIMVIENFGLWRGGWLAFKRLMRCNPFNAGGYDPCPNAKTNRGPQENSSVFKTSSSL